MFWECPIRTRFDTSFYNMVDSVQLNNCKPKSVLKKTRYDAMYKWSNVLKYHILMLDFDILVRKMQLALKV